MNNIKKLTFLKVFIFIVCLLISGISTFYICFKVFVNDHRIKILKESEIKEIVSKYGCSGTDSYESDRRVDYSFYTEDTCPFYLGYMVFNDEDYLEFVYYLLEAEVESNGGPMSTMYFDIETFSYYEAKSNKTLNMKLASYNNSVLIITTAKEDVDLFNNLITDTGYYYNFNFEYFKYMFIPVLSFFIGIFALSYINKKGQQGKYYGM